MTERTDVTSIWRDYQRGIDYLTKRDLFQRVEDSYAFAEGDQWRGLESGGERMPQLNFLKPVMKYGVAIVAQNTMAINYSPMDFDPQARQMKAKICEQLNAYAAQTWERVKLDKLSWDIIQDAYIAGDGIPYFYDAVVNGKHTVKMELIDNTNLLLADEQNPDIQAQPYILIIQRRYVKDVIEEAKANEISEDDIKLILPDSDDEHNQGTVDEVENELKCTVVLKMYKKDGKVYIARATKTVEYQKDTPIEGLTLYPLAKYSWNLEHGSARGLGDIYDKIPNQIEVNKALARLAIATKEFSFPHIVYDSTKISEDSVKDLSVIGSLIDVTSGNGKASDIVSYMQAANINPLAKEIITDLISQTRELAGAGEAVTGNINPEKASGAAIIAAKDASALPLNMNMSGWKQCAEDIAAILIDMWRAYSVDGIDVVLDEQPTHIPYEALQGLEVDIRIDVSPTNPYSKYAQEQGLTQLFQAQQLTFEEFVEALDDDSSIPKQKLQDIIDKRQTQQRMMDEMKQYYEGEIQRRDIAMQQLAEQAAQGENLKQALPQQIEQATKVGMQKQADEDKRRAQVEQLKAQITEG